MYSPVAAKGQVFLDEIRTIKEDFVTFYDPLFTNDGRIGTLDTDAFTLTRQFELNVNVKNVFLTGQDGSTSFTGTLGGLIVSRNGDVVFQGGAEGFITAGGEINAVLQGDVNFAGTSLDAQSLYPTRFTAGTARFGSSFDTNIATSGALTFDSGDNVLLRAGDRAFMTGGDLLSFTAVHGNLLAAAGKEMTVGAAGRFLLDGTHGTSISTQGTLDVVGGRNVTLSAITSNTLVRNNASIAYERVNLFGDDGVVIGGRTVELDARGALTVAGEFPGSVVTFDYGKDLNLNAARDLIFRSLGKNSDIRFTGRDFATSSSSYTLTARVDAMLGSNTTQNFDTDASQFSFESAYAHVRSGKVINVTSSSSTSFTSEDMIVHGTDYKLTASGSFVTFNSRELELVSKVGGVTDEVYFQTDGSITTSSDSLEISAFSFYSYVNNTQSFRVQNLDVASGTDGNIVLYATNAGSISVADDIDVLTGESRFISGGSLSLSVTDYSLVADKFTMNVAAVTYNSGDRFQLTSARDFLLQSGPVSITADDQFFLTVPGTSSVDADDLSFIGTEDVDVNAAQTIHLDMRGMTTMTSDEMTINAGNNIYLKTSIFSLSGLGDVAINTGGIGGVFGELTFDAEDDLDFFSQTDLSISGGGNIRLTSVGGQNFTIGNDLRIRTQEYIRLSGGDDVLVDIENDVTISGSEDFLFQSQGNQNITSADNIQFVADIIEYRAQETLTTTSGASNLIRGGDITMTANDFKVAATTGDMTLTTPTFSHEISFEGGLGFAINAGGNATVPSSGDQRVYGTTLNINAADDFTFTSALVGAKADSFTVTANSNGTLAGDNITIRSGLNDQFIMNATRNVISTIDLESNIRSGTALNYTAQTGTFTVTAAQNGYFRGNVSSTISTLGNINTTAERILEVNSAEDLSFQTLKSDLTIKTSLGSIASQYARDFDMIANGLDGKTCAVAFQTNNGIESLLSSTQGLLTVDGNDGFDISTNGDYIANSDGSIFMESFMSGFMFFVGGNEDGLTLRTTADNGNIEIISAESDIKFVGVEGFTFESGEDTNIHSQLGLSIRSNSSNDGLTRGISFSSGTEMSVAGARGLFFKAGIDAPVRDGPFDLDADDINVRSQDFFYVEAIDDVTLYAADNVLITNEEGQRIRMSVANNFTNTATDDVTYTTEDGDMFFFANNRDYIVNAQTGVKITTDDGPIALSALAGEVSMTGETWSTTANMDFRVLALGSVNYISGDELQVTSRVPSRECILLQNTRAIDDITFNGQNILATSNSQGLNFIQSDIQVEGYNVDFRLNNSATFTSTGSTVIGGNSSPLVRMVAGGTATIPGLTIESDYDIETATFYTLQAEAPFATFQGDELILKSAGLIQITAKNEQLTFEALAGEYSWDAREITTSVIGDHTIIADTLYIAQEGKELGGRQLFFVEGETQIFATDLLLQADFTNDLNVLGAVTTDAQTIEFRNLVTDDTNQPQPFFSEEPTERGEILFTVGGIADFNVDGDGFFEVGRDGPQLPLSNEPTFTVDTDSTLDINTVNLAIEILELDALLKIGAGQDLRMETDDTFTITTNSAPQGTNAAPYRDHPSDVDFVTGAFSLVAQNNIFQDVTRTASFKVNDLTEVQFGGAATVQTTNNADGRPNVQFSAAGTTTIDAATGSTFTITNQAATPPAADGDDLPILFYAADDLMMTSTTGATTITSANSMTFISQEQATVSVTGDLTLDTPVLAFTSTAIGGDINFNDVTFTLAGTDLKVTGSEGVTVEAEATLSVDVTGGSFTSRTSNGDINVQAQDAVITSTQDITFRAEGQEPDDLSAFSLLADNGLSLTATTGDMSFMSKTRTDFFVEDNINVNGVGVYLFQSTGENSPIQFINHNGFRATGALNVLAGQDIDYQSAVMQISATDIDVTTTFSDTGILFETDPHTNKLTQLTFSASATLTLSNTPYIRFQTEISSAEDSPIQFSAPLIDINSLSSSPVVMTAEEGELRVNGADVSVASAGHTLFSGDAFDFSGSLTATTVDLHITSTDNDVTFTHDTNTNLNNLQNVYFSTEGLGRDNDITYTADGNLNIGNAATTVIDFFSSNGGSSSVVFTADFSPNSRMTSTAAGDINYETLAGIRILGTEHDNANEDIDFTAGNSILIRAEDRRGSVFFQSDRDTIIDTGDQIIMTNYHARLGFFSQLPDQINYVNTQIDEVCLQGGRCGFSQRLGNATGSLALVSRVAYLLQSVLRQYGLVIYTTPIVGER